MAETCHFCGTDPNGTDATRCRTRGEALGCAWLPEETRQRALDHNRTVDASLDRISMLDAFRGARRLAKRKRDPNWVFAMQMFGLGSGYAWAMCERLGVDPDGTSPEPIRPVGA